LLAIQRNRCRIPLVHKPLPSGGCYLFSVDVEDVQDRLPSGDRFGKRAGLMLSKYLEFLDRQKMKATFFVVGSFARSNPSLVGEIIAEGHEVAAHGHDHVSVDSLGREGFKQDLQENLDDLRRCGAEAVLGYRAPFFSFSKATQWAYEVLEECGFQYSSSVLPARNPQYGWPEFGTDIRRLNNLWELPVSVASFRGLGVPYAGGAYFRVVPFWLILYLCRRSLRRGYAVRGYFHPYDIDAKEERFNFPGIDSRFFNYLLYYGRDTVLNKLAMLFEKTNCYVVPYIDYVRRLVHDEKAD